NTPGFGPGLRGSSPLPRACAIRHSSPRRATAARRRRARTPPMTAPRAPGPPPAPFIPPQPVNPRPSSRNGCVTALAVMGAVVVVFLVAGVAIGLVAGSRNQAGPTSSTVPAPTAANSAGGGGGGSGGGGGGAAGSVGQSRANAAPVG